MEETDIQLPHWVPQFIDQRDAKVVHFCVFKHLLSLLVSQSCISFLVRGPRPTAICQVWKLAEGRRIQPGDLRAEIP